MNWMMHWQQYFEDSQYLEALVEQGFVVLDHALPESLYMALVLESREDEHYQAAKISTGGRLETVRSDSTRWIESDPTVNRQAGAEYLEALEALSLVLNRALYLGIRSVEAHYACYQVGQFYAQHRDNASGSDVRAISTVLYLNHGINQVDSNNWRAEWGGALRLVDASDAVQDILPIGNRLVVFQSDLPHEVLPATVVRRSIAGWLRRDTTV
ncbi:2OG-Fe(II) oxygenase [Aquirhabdus parva]|uniref:2OG-Fe(II) oxygenase n=1 Tax=Aquirhabdus parva TaxID=2283318 RepID=A0A345P6Z3_9GAMM|nr:2OG-Fe(II) oxygenase [Aquirhabdus parva]AXI03052.1 2OG-Fe(II) oxygenase [Aquirhabdus parva]